MVSSDDGRQPRKSLAQSFHSAPSGSPATTIIIRITRLSFNTLGRCSQLPPGPTHQPPPPRTASHHRVPPVASSTGPGTYHGLGLLEPETLGRRDEACRWGGWKKGIAACMGAACVVQMDAAQLVLGLLWVCSFVVH